MRFGESRTIRTLGLWTDITDYSQKVLNEATTYGLTMNPAVKPDVMALTTYFGNGIQKYAFEKGQWLDGASQQELDALYKEWELRILSSEAVNVGKDLQGGGGGFPAIYTQWSKQYNLPIVAYEGGTSLNSDFAAYMLDCFKLVDQSTPGAIRYNMLGWEGADHCGGGNPTGRNAYLGFIKSIQRDMRYGDMLYLSSVLAKAKGAKMISQFGDFGAAGSVYGMWGQWEAIDQNNSNSPKYMGWEKLFNEYKNLREIDDSVGTRPVFAKNGELYPAKMGEAYYNELTYSGGDGALTIKLLGSGYLPAGLSFTYQTGNIIISGTPTEETTTRFAFRLTDSNKDYTLGVYTLRSLPSVKNKVFAYDNFGVQNNVKLHGSVNGFGFNSAWSVQSSDTTWRINTTTPLTYSGLDYSGSGNANIGGSYRSVGRALNVDSFSYLKDIANPTYLGQTGTTLWLSFLVKTTNVSNTGDIFYLLDGDEAWAATERLIKIQKSSNGKWAIAVRKKDNTFVTTETNIAVTANTTHLVVLAVSFEPVNDVINLWIDPIQLGDFAPATPALTYTTPGDLNMLVRYIGANGSKDKNIVFIDDVRLGDSYKAVTPTSPRKVQTDEKSDMICNIYPNPAKDMAFIDLRGFDENEVITVSIVNINGQVLFLENIKGNNSFTLQTSNMDKGLYLVNVMSKKQISRQKLIIE